MLSVINSSEMPAAVSRPVPSAAVIVAHPDDETLWAGGLILAHPEWRWFVATLCRAGDTDRAPRFFRVLARLAATGAMAGLDDGPEQVPLPDDEVQEGVLALLPPLDFDLVVTHGPQGEYTRHRRHEETSRAVIGLWGAGRIASRALWLFAYEDGGRQYLPRPVERAHRREILPEPLWQAKYQMITELYGFAPESWEARTTPREEAFWCFDSPRDVRVWLGESE